MKSLQVLLLTILMIGILGAPVAHAFGFDKDTVCANCLFSDLDNHENEDSDTSSEVFHASAHNFHHHTQLVNFSFILADKKMMNSFLSTYEIKIKPSPVYGLKRPPRFAA